MKREHNPPRRKGGENKTLASRMAGVLILMAVTSFSQAGTIYKFIDEDGLITYRNYIPKGKIPVLIIPVKSSEASTEISIKPPPSNPKLTKPEKSFKSVPLRYRGGVYELKATINNEVTVYFVVDSGAATVSISGSAARILVDNGSLSSKNLLGKSKYVMADGSTKTVMKVLLDSLAIGDFVMHNVEANIIEDPNAPSLLGQSALKLFGRWNIDVENHTFTYTAP